MTIELLERGDGDAARAILEALPDWFGRTDARETYLSRVAELPMLIHGARDNPTGFLSLQCHTPGHAEIHVMGVLPAHRRRGIGRQLVRAAVTWCLARNIRFLSVKTLADAVPDERYAETRAFYTAMGFELFEVLPDLWSADTPAALFLQVLTKENRR